MAGGGKTHLALLKALHYASFPHAKVLIMRATYPLLKAIGGISQSSQEMYRDFGAEFKSQPLEFHFPNGSMIKLVAIPDNLNDVLGWQPTHVLFDEATEASLEAILALQGRIRSAKYQGPRMSMMLTCNPSRSSYLYSFVEFCLDEFGVPKEGTELRKRYFVNIQGKMYWDDTQEALYAKHGFGKTLGVDFIPLSFKFIPLTIDSNPALLKVMPQYKANLLAQSRVNQLRLLHGSWTAVVEGSSVFNREWVPIVEHAPAEVGNVVRSWDLAHSVPSETYPDPDWTAGVKMSRTKDGRYCIEHVKRDRRLTDGVVRLISDTAIGEDGLNVTVTIPKDNGGGKAATQFFIRALSEQGITVKGIPISGHTSKMQRFLPFCSMCEAGLVTMVRGDWNEDFLTELEHFQGIRNEKNDQCDAVADAFNHLARGNNIPEFVVPDLSQASPIPSI